MEKFLEKEEILKIELNQREERLRKAEEARTILEMKIKTLEIDNLKKDLEIIQLKREKVALRHNQERTKSREFIEELKQKYDVKVLGFDPESGLIKE